MKLKSNCFASYQFKTKYKTKQNRNQRNLVCQGMNGIIGWSNVMISMKNMQQKYENQWMQQSHKSINVYHFFFPRIGMVRKARTEVERCNFINSVDKNKQL